jgi:hypothetical protein
MRTLCALLSVVIFCSFIYATDTTVAKPGKATVAQAKAPAAKPSTTSVVPATTEKTTPQTAAPVSAQTPVTSSAPAATTQTPPPATVVAAPASTAPAPVPVAAPAPVAEPAPAPVQVKAAAPEPAPAKQPTECPMKKDAKCCAAMAPAQCTPPQPITWYGMAMLRLREEIVSNYAKSGLIEKSATFSFPLAYKIGIKAKPNDQTLLHFELGNDWYATETATGIPGNYYTKRNPMTPWFCLAYAQWDPGFLQITAGIIPVQGTAMLDLLGASILFNKSYKLAAHVPWGVVTNFSQTGLKLGAPIIKGPFAIGVDLTSAIIQQRSTATATDKMKFNASAIEFLLTVPMSVEGLKINPQAFIIPNRSYNATKDKGDVEYGMGLDLGYKIADGITARAGIGYARNSNALSYSATNIVAVDPFNAAAGQKPDTLYDRYGTNSNIGITAKIGPGKFDFDFNLSNEYNTCDTANVNDWYPFFDIKYGVTLSKHFVVMPRVRLFFTEPKVNYNNKLTTRPEIIIVGTF